MEFPIRYKKYNLFFRILSVQTQLLQKAWQANFLKKQQMWT